MYEKQGGNVAGSALAVDGFARYRVETNETPAAFIAVVGLFVALTISLVTPFACWSGERARRRKTGGTVAPSADADAHHEQNPSHREQLSEMGSDVFCSRHQRDSPKVANLSAFHREHLAAMKQLAQEKISPLHHRDRVSDPNNADRSSAVPSLASTSRVYAERRTFLSRMPWSHGRPFSRSETVQRFVQLERQSQVSGEGSHTGRSLNSCAASQSQLNRGRAMSEAGRVFLELEAIEGEAEYYRQRYIEQYRNPDRRSHRHKPTRRSSLGGRSDGSVMAPLDPDAVSPHDAADANDPGQVPAPIQYATYNSTYGDQTSQSLQLSNAISAQFSNILNLAEFNYEYKRILTLAVPSTIGAMADPLCRIVLVAIISHFIDTNSMVAYLLVILFIRLTIGGIRGAIADAESNMVQDALDQGGDLCYYVAGRTVLLAVVLQIFVGGPVLLMWVFVMEKAVNWLVSNSEIADIASTYTAVIIIDYIIKGASKSFMIPFHLTGKAQFESHVDLLATIVTGVAIAIVATTNDLSLSAIGWIQVIIGIGKAVTKVAYVSLRGWFLPYRSGFLACMVSPVTARAESYATILSLTLMMQDATSLVNFMLQAFPLFLGSLLDLGEWEVLSLFVGRLGGAEGTNLLIGFPGMFVAVRAER
jgi:hypothetical protein